MRIIFLGTPDFAVPSLKALINNGYDVVAVVCQPDKAGNRGKSVFCPVKSYAVECGIPVLQFAKIRLEGAEILRSYKPDLMVTAAYGQIISQEILDIPRFGVINVHGSLLPKYRGAAPIQQCVLDGEKESGVTIMRTALSVDSGDIICSRVTPIGENETAGELFDRLAVIGGEALIEAVNSIEDGTVTYTKQDETKATFCKMFTKEMGEISFDKTFAELKNFVRGMSPWPGAFTHLNGKILKIFSLSYVEDSSSAKTGTVLKAGAKCGLVVKIKDGAVSLDEIQAEGGKRMTANAYLVGHAIEEGTVFE